jgi:hypothetical protein
VFISGSVVDGIHTPGLHHIQKFVLVADGTENWQQFDRNRLTTSAHYRNNA